MIILKKPCLKPSQCCKKQGVVIFTYEPLSFSEIAQNDVQAAFSECYINKLAKGIGKPVMGRVILQGLLSFPWVRVGISPAGLLEMPLGAAVILIMGNQREMYTGSRLHWISGFDFCCVIQKGSSLSKTGR